jgi:hypothetical protein
MSNIVGEFILPQSPNDLYRGETPNDPDKCILQTRGTCELLFTSEGGEVNEVSGKLKAKS